MTDKRVVICISTSSLTLISADQARAASSYGDSISSSSFLPPLHLDEAPRPQRFRSESPQVVRDAPFRHSRSQSDPADTEAERAATVSRLSRFAYRSPTPKKSPSQLREPHQAEDSSALATSMPRPPAPATTTAVRERSRSTSTEISGIHDVSESQWAAVVLKRDSSVSQRTSPALEGNAIGSLEAGAEGRGAMTGAEGLEGLSDDEDLERLQAEAERSLAQDSDHQVMGVMGGSSKRRKLDRTSPSRHASSSPSLLRKQKSPPSSAAPIATSAYEHSAKVKTANGGDAMMAASSPRSVNTDDIPDTYPNSMIDDRPLPSFYTSDAEEADPESEAVTSRVGYSSPVPCKKGRKVRRLDPDEVQALVVSDDDEENHITEAGPSRSRSEGGIGRKRRAISTSTTGSERSEGEGEEDDEEEEEEVDWTPSPPSQRQRERSHTRSQNRVSGTPSARARRNTSPPSLSAQRRISTGRRAAVAARAAAKKYVVLSDEEDEEFDPDRPSDEESGDGRRHRLESAFEKEYKKQLADESEGTEEDDGYDDDPDDERQCRRIPEEEEEEEEEEEGLELGTAFQVHDEEIIEEDNEDGDGAAISGGNEHVDTRDGVPGQGGTDEYDEYDEYDHLLIHLDMDQYASSSALQQDRQSSTAIDKRSGATPGDLFGDTHSGHRPAPSSSSGPSAASRSIPSAAFAPMSSLLDKLDMSSPLPSTSAPSSSSARKKTTTGSRDGKGAQSASAEAESTVKTKSKGKSKAAQASSSPLDDLSTNVDATTTASTIAADAFIRVSLMPPREKEFYSNHWRRGQEGVAKAPMRATAAAKKRSEAVEALLLDAQTEDAEEDHVPDGFDDLDLEEIDWDVNDVEADLRGSRGSAAGSSGIRLAPVFGAGASSGMPQPKPAIPKSTSGAGPSRRKPTTSRTSQGANQYGFGPSSNTGIDQYQEEEDDFDPYSGGPQGVTKSMRGGRGRGRGGRGWRGAKRGAGAGRKKGASRAKK